MWCELTRDFVRLNPQYAGFEGGVDDVVRFLCPHGVKVGGIYQHFKGNRYLVTGFARDSGNWEGDPLVRYVNLEDASTEVTRNLAEFLESVDQDGYKGPRFKLVG